MEGVVINNLKYKRKLKLSKYIFNGQDMLFDFFDDFESQFNNKAHSYEIKLVNEFGTISLNNLYDLKEEIKLSSSLYSIFMKITSEDNNTLIHRLYVYEDFKHISFIDLLSNDKGWIQTTEQSIISNLPDKNWALFFTNPFMKMLLSIFFSFILLSSFFRNNEELVKSIQEPQSILLIMVVFFIMLFMVEIILIIFIPTFLVRKKSSLFFRIKRAFTNKANLEAIIIAMVTGFFFLFLSIVIPKLIK